MRNHVLTLCALFLALLSFLSCTSDLGDDQPRTPVISSFSPASGTEGSTVIIKGYFFSSDPDNNIVKINGLTATVVAASETELTIVVPENATSGKITVEVGNRSAISATDFIVDPSVPVVTTIAPESGDIGTEVELTGLNFRAGAKVFFGAVEAIDVTVVSATKITARVPVGATSNNVKVVYNAKEGLSPMLFWVKPEITAFTPASGKEGDVVEITGTNFTENTTLLAVFFGGVAVTEITEATATSIKVKVPSGAVDGKIAVKVNQQQVESANEFIIVPSVSSYTPDRGERGSTVIINGTGFSTAMDIVFNGVTVAASDIVSITNTVITFKVPATATSGAIKLKKGTIEISVGNYAVTNIWSLVNAIGLSSSYYQAISFVYNNKFYVGLGDRNNVMPFVYNTDFWYYDPASNTWTKDVEMSVAGGISTRRFASATVNGSKVYIGSGIDAAGATTRTWRVFDFVTKTWSSIPDLPTSAYENIAFSLSGRSYVGLGTGDNMYVFNPSTNAWSDFVLGAPYRTGGFVFMINDVAYFGGGGAPLKTDFYKFDPSVSTTATPLANVPTGVTHVAFAINGKGYVVYRDEKLYEYSPSSNNWVERTAAPEILLHTQVVNNRVFGITHNGKVYEYIPNN